MSFFHDRDYTGFFCIDGPDVKYVSDQDVDACGGSISKAVAKYGRLKAVVAPSGYHLARLFPYE